jgi:DNA helicase HerA-like ATPase
MTFRPPAAPRLTLGTYGPLSLFKWTVSQSDIACHIHTLGKTKSGKSYFLANLVLALHEAGMAATLIDPHGDLAGLILRQPTRRVS